MADAQLRAVITAEDRASKVIAQVGTSMEAVGTSLTSVSSKLRDMDVLFKGMTIAGAAGVGAIALLGKSALSAAADYEQSQIAFTTMLGSADKAFSFMRELAAFAKKTPFTLVGIEDAAKKLLAYGVTQDKVLPNLKVLGDIAAGVGTDKLPQLILAFGQVRGAGKLMGTELRQFTEAGVPLLEELSKVTGLSVQDMAGNVGHLGITFEQVEQALTNLTQGGGRFSDLMDKQSLSLKGMMSNLEDSWEMFMRTHGQKLLPLAKEVVDALRNILIKVGEFIDQHPKIAAAALAITGGLSAVLLVAGSIGLILPTLITGFTQLGAAVKLTGEVITFLTTNPAALWLVAIGLIVAGLILLYKNSEDFRNAVNGLVDKVQEISGKFIEWVKNSDEVKGAIQTLKDKALEIWTVFKDQLYPAFEQFWQLIKERLYPALQEVWAALQPLMPYFELMAKVIGAILLVALLLLVEAFTKIVTWVTNALTWLTKLVTWITDKGSKFITNFAGEIEGITNAFKSVVEWVEKAINKLDSFLSKSKSLGDGKGGIIGGLIDKIIPSFRASGGSVNPNQPYIVGEHGAELFTPSGYGSITSNNKLGSGGGINIVIYGDVSGEEIVDKVKRSLMNEIKQNAFV